MHGGDGFTVSISFQQPVRVDNHRAEGWANLANIRDTLAGDRDARTNHAATRADDRDLRADDRDTFANDAANFANDAANFANDRDNFANDGAICADDRANFANDWASFASNRATHAASRSIPANDGDNLADDSASVAVSGESCGQASIRCVHRNKHTFKNTCSRQGMGIKNVSTYATQVLKHHRNGSHRGCLYEPERHDLERHESGR